MTRLFILLFLGTAIAESASAQLDTTPNRASHVAAYLDEVEALRSALDIPGLALTIIEGERVVAAVGLGETRDGTPFTTATPLRIASVSKAVAATLLLQAEGRGHLGLDDRVRDYLPDFAGDPSVTIRHLLTHTSEGIPGTEYVYGTTRYAMLGDVLAARYDTTYEAILRDHIIGPAGMAWYDSPFLGTHAGLVSTVDDMGLFMRAYHTGLLLPATDRARLAIPSQTPEGHALPTSLGWFAQTIQGVRVQWSFGQDDPDHSGALLLHLPDHNLSLFILANANVLSDPFRLLMGDARRSPFATAFVRTFAFPDMPKAPDWQTSPIQIGADLDVAEQSSYRFHDEVLAHAVAQMWTGNEAQGSALFDLWLDRYPEAASTPDPVKLFYATVAPIPRLKPLGLAMADTLVGQHPRNRWVLLSSGYLYDQMGHTDRMRAAFEGILTLPNQEPDFLHRLFGAWARTALAQSWKEDNPDEARRLLREVLNLGISGETLEQAEALLAALES